MGNCISADSSFYICLIDDIDHEICLNKFSEFYSFFVGKSISKEINSKSRKNLDLNYVDFDYYELVNFNY